MTLPSVKERRAQISISGTLGSGKSTVGRALAEILGWRFVSTGSVQREISQSLGLSTLELNKIAETDRSIDERVDRVFHELSKAENIIVDSRMAWHFLPNSFRVRLVLAPELAAARIMKDAKRSAEKYADPAIAVADIAARAASERQRFMNTYGVDITIADHYDLVVDTADASPDAVLRNVMDSYNAWKKEL